LDSYQDARNNSLVSMIHGFFAGNVLFDETMFALAASSH